MTSKEASTMLYLAAHDVVNGNEPEHTLERSALAFALAWMQERGIIRDAATLEFFVKKIEEDDSLYPPG